jgi:hypothetical protein
LELAARPASRYRALLLHEAELRRHLLYGAAWRRLEMRHGVLSEEMPHDISSDNDVPHTSLRAQAAQGGR